MAPIKSILHITPFFRPNIGGVETHLDDLTRELQKRGYHQTVLTYSPLTTNTPYKKSERSKNLQIHRFYLPGHNLFHTLEKFPFLNFLYITPALLIRSAIWLLAHKLHFDTIHSHGLNGALVGNVLKFIFGINKHVTSIYSTYDNVPLSSLSTKFLVSILNATDQVLTQTNQSIDQLIHLGVNRKIISRYQHWIDLKRFRPAKRKLSPFSILFVGRLLPQKNALTIASLAPSFPKVSFDFIGTGPQYQSLYDLSQKYKNIHLLGDIPYQNLHNYYQQATIFCLPSVYQEGWGRVLAESVACGTPVICSNLGGTTEAIDSTVAIIVKPTKQNFYKAIKKFIDYPNLVTQMSKKCRPYAMTHYPSDNISHITRAY